MEKKFRDQLLAESGKKEEEIENVNLEIEEREKSETGPFVLIRNKKNKWVITTWNNTRKINTRRARKDLGVWLGTYWILM